MKPAPTFVESGFLYESTGRDPLLLGHATLTVDSDGIWRIRQLWRTGWCQVETTHYEYDDEAGAREQMAYIYAYGEPLGTWRKRTA